jgi:hypothetical protein
LDDEVAGLLEQDPDGGWIGRKLSQVLLGFLATEVVPLTNRLAGLGIDPTPLLATASGILGLYPRPWTVLTLARDSRSS